jgi:hypothetical protein
LITGKRWRTRRIHTTWIIWTPRLLVPKEQELYAELEKEEEEAPEARPLKQHVLIQT